GGTEGCIVSGSFDFVGTPAVTAEAVVLDTIECSGKSLGSVQILASGGSGTYEYSTDGSFTDGNINNPIRDSLAAGFITLFVRDADNPECVTQVFAFVVERDPIQITALFETVEPATCDNNDGVVKIPRITGGSLPYTNYRVDGVGYTLNADSTISGLGRGDHLFTVEDINGCTQDFVFNVGAPDLVIFNATADSASCTGNGADGRIRVDSIRGDGGPYFFSLSLDQPFQQVENDPFFIEDLAPGTYDIFIRSGDAESSCPNVQTVEVFGFEPVSFEFTSTDMSCDDIEDGVIVLSEIRGGIGNSDDLSIFLNGTLIETNVESREYFLRDLSRGTYTVELRRGGECASSQEEDITISAPDRFQTDPNTPNPVITTSNQPGRLPFTGSIQILDIVGGTAPYTVDLIGLDVSYREEDVAITTLNSNGYSIIFEELEDSEYQLDFLDSLGCEFTLIVQVAADTTVFIPTAFSPDDNGINDNLQIGNLSFIQTRSQLDFELIVYNRWGDVIKRVPNYDNGLNVWDGTGGADNGQLPDGVYFVTLQPMGSGQKDPEFIFKTMVEIIRER
ncbi:MAG: gliding motility-associated C-terminal domain-containing protein, partial [Bacteroidota bacterium]